MDSNVSSPLFPTPPVCSSDSYWTASRIIVIATLVLVIVSNALMILVTHYAMRSHFSGINAFLFNSLAMSDLLTGIFVLPFNAVFAFQGKDASPGHAMCTFSGVMFHILQMISLFSFFGLSLDRLLSIAYPFMYLTLLTRKVNVISICVIWLVPTMMYGAIPATGLGFYVYKCWQSMCNLGPVNMDFLTFLMLFSVAVFLTTYIINGCIFYIARKQHMKIAKQEQLFHTNTGQKLGMRSRMRAARSIMMALSLFTLCWGPYYTALFCFVLFGVMISPATEFALLWLAISNSYMNFFVFLATYRTFRMHFLCLLGFRNRVGQASTGIQTTSDNQ